MKNLKLALLIAVFLLPCLSNAYAYTFGSTLLFMTIEVRNPDDGKKLYMPAGETGWWSNRKTTKLNPVCCLDRFGPGGFFPIQSVVTDKQYYLSW